MSRGLSALRALPATEEQTAEALARGQRSAPSDKASSPGAGENLRSTP